MATPPVHGAFVEYVVWPSDFVLKLPPETPFQAGALCEPLSVALQGVKQGRPRPGAKVSILGAGPIGLSLLQASLAYGASEVYITDIYPLRLEKAKEMGATEVINAKESDPVEAVLELTKGKGAEVVYEAAGSVVAQRQAFRVVKSGGTVVLVGMTAEEENTVPLLDLICREYEVKGVMRYANTYPEAVALTASGKVNLLPMVTHKFPLEQAKEALEFSDTQKDKAIKVMVEI